LDAIRRLGIKPVSADSAPNPPPGGATTLAGNKRGLRPGVVVVGPDRGGGRHLEESDGEDELNEEEHAVGAGVTFRKGGAIGPAFGRNEVASDFCCLDSPLE